jgi:coronin-7
VFETKVKDESPENEDFGNFERGTNRNSIAERRRLYESRSVSVTDGNLAEKAMGSPTMLRRRDSFKAKSEVIKEDETKKNIPMLRQQSMDPKLEKVEPVVTPASKRTSTVFGKSLQHVSKVVFHTCRLMQIPLSLCRKSIQISALERYSRTQIYPH